MARTLNANWVRAFRRAQVRPVILATVALGERPDVPESLLTASWVSGDAPLFGYPCSISGLSTLSVEVHPITRRMSVGEINLSFVDDGTLRAIGAAYTLKNRRVTIKLGTPELAEADFEVLAAELRIDEVVPSRGVIEVSLTDTRTEPLDLRDDAFEFPDHPWRLMQRVLRRGYGRSRALAPDTNFSLAASDTSHFVVTRHQYHPAPEDDVTPQENAREPLIDRLQALTELAYTVLRADELGQAEAVAWDPSPAGGVAFELGADDVADVEQVSTYEDLISRVTCDYALSVKTVAGRVGGSADIEIEPRYQARDAAAEEDLRGPYWGQDVAIYEHQIASDFFAGGATVGGYFPGSSSGPQLSASATSLPVPLPLWHGFCGTLTTDAGYRVRLPGTPASSAIYGSPMSAQLFDVVLGVNVIQVDAMRDGTASWNKTAIEATYAGAGNYSSNNLEVIWFSGPVVGGVELGRAVVTSASSDGKWLRFEAISPSVAANIGAASIVAPDVYYEVRSWSSPQQPLSSTIASAQQVSAGRPGYLKLIQRSDPTKQEIVKTTAFAYDVTAGATSKIFASNERIGEPDSLSRQYWNRGTFTIERGQLGTTARSFDATTVAIDITIPVWLSAQLLARAHYGIPRVKLRLGLHYLGAEVGDIVTLADSMILTHRLSGSTHAAMTWEITSLEVDLISESPGINVTLAAAEVSSHTPADVVPLPPIGRLANPLLQPYFDNSVIPYIDGTAVTYTTRY